MATANTKPATSKTLSTTTKKPSDLDKKIARELEKSPGGSAIASKLLADAAKPAQPPPVPAAVRKAPQLPKVEANSELPLTDPKRRLTKEELKSLTKEQRAARRAAIRSTAAPSKAKIARNIERTAKRLERVARMFGGEQAALGSAVAAAVKQLRGVVVDMDDLPDSWRPTTGKTPRAAVAALAAGDAVQIIEKRRAQYAQFVEPEHVAKLKLDRIVGNKVVVVTPDGVKLFLPANVIEKAPATT